MKKTIVVKTDDPDNKKFNLVVTGPVEKIVDVKPASVYMNGKPGDTLESFVTITPAPKFEFSILDVKQKINKGITASLIEPVNGKKSWQIKLTSTSDKADDLYEVLTVKTDSKYKPTLTIRVYAIFLDKKSDS
jgi:hypothetical protein